MEKQHGLVWLESLSCQFQQRRRSLVVTNLQNLFTTPSRVFISWNFFSRLHTYLVYLFSYCIQINIRHCLLVVFNVICQYEKKKKTRQYFLNKASFSETTLFVLIFARINFRASWIEYNFARFNFRARPFYKKFFLYNLFETDEKRINQRIFGPCSRKLHVKTHNKSLKQRMTV